MSTKSTAHISVAPMMGWTDRHCRYFHRLISPHTVLYSEMITTGALLHGDSKRFLRFNDVEHPIVLQLGGSDPQDLALCAKMAQDHGYDEINLNCGCPSDRVQSGRFGACMMKEPDHVARCIKIMNQAVSIPVTVKCRIGVDEFDSFEFLCNFVEKLADIGCIDFIVHARKAWLKGLSPKENREIPPLDYEVVEKIKKRYPHLRIILNGGITTLESVRKNINRFNGLMIGREAYQNPYFLAEIEQEIFSNNNMLTRDKVALSMIPYIASQMSEHGTPVKSITRHMIGLFHGQPGARKWRQALSTLPHEEGADENIIKEALYIKG